MNKLSGLGFYFLINGCPMASAPFVSKAIFPPFSYFCTSISWVSLCIFCILYSMPLIHMSIPPPILHTWLLELFNILKLRKQISLTRFFIFKLVLTLLAPLHFHIHFFFFFFGPCCMACGIVAPQPGTEPEPSAVKAQSSNHWTAREFPPYTF